jgi:hypothetical protein
VKNSARLSRRASCPPDDKAYKRNPYCVPTESSCNDSLPMRGLRLGNLHPPPTIFNSRFAFHEQFPIKK